MTRLLDMPEHKKKLDEYLEAHKPDSPTVRDHTKNSSGSISPVTTPPDSQFIGIYFHPDQQKVMGLLQRVKAYHPQEISREMRTHMTRLDQWLKYNRGNPPEKSYRYLSDYVGRATKP